jgi:hypothetical protein
VIDNPNAPTLARRRRQLWAPTAPTNNPKRRLR